MTGLDQQIDLRPFPYPYRAALAICSDIDNCDRKTFVAVHRYLNCPRKGLGLPVADSFFAWGREPEHMAYFLPDGKTPSADAPLIVRAIRGGLIDTLHAWGDFHIHAPEPAFLRHMAERLTRELVDQDLTLRVWVNHGDLSNRQNLRMRFAPAYFGDDLRSPYYTGDLYAALGVKFYWWSELVQWPLSCRRGLPAVKKTRMLLNNSLKSMAKLLLGQRRRIKTGRQLLELGVPVRMRDGQRLIGFTRFNRHPGGIWGQPTRHTLRHTLVPPVLDELVAREGYLILYTHLGQPRHLSGDLFPGPDREALARLAAYYHDGRIWVAPTGQLLTYWLAHQKIAWQVSRRDERIFIDVEKIDDPTTGPRTPAKEELSGICFYSPEPNATVIRVDSETVDTRVYPPDHTGMGMVGIDPPTPPSLEPLEA